MEHEVKVNPAGVRKLRESKSWTQEHLASAAGILGGSSTPEQASTALGILGAFAGISAGAIGVLAQRAQARARCLRP